MYIAGFNPLLAQTNTGKPQPVFQNRLPGNTPIRLEKNRPAPTVFSYVKFRLRPISIR